MHAVVEQEVKLTIVKGLTLTNIESAVDPTTLHTCGVLKVCQLINQQKSVSTFIARFLDHA